MYESKLSRARLGLLNRLMKYQQIKKNIDILVFFDGRKEKGSVVTQDEYCGIKIQYSHERKADVLIKKYVKTCLSRPQVLTITSDKDILYHCKNYGITTNTSEEFSEKMQKCFLPVTNKQEEKQADVQLSAEEIDYWQQVFTGKRK